MRDSAALISAYYYPLCCVNSVGTNKKKHSHQMKNNYTMVVWMYSSELLPTRMRTIHRTHIHTAISTGSLSDCLLLAIREWHMTCLGECVVYTALASPTLAYLGSYQSLLLSRDTEHWPDTETGLRWFITAFVTSLSSQTVINPILNSCEK